MATNGLIMAIRSLRLYILTCIIAFLQVGCIHSKAAESEKRPSIYNDSACLTHQNENILNTRKQRYTAPKASSAHSLRSVHNYFIAAFTVIIVLIYALLRYRMKIKQSEQLYSKLEKKYSMTKQQLKQKEMVILNLQKKTDILQCADIQKKILKKDIKELENKRNALAKDVYEHSNIYNKMQKIIREYIKKDRSDIKFEEEDWQQLIAETDMRWQNISLRLREQYNLTQEDIHICCLYLTDIRPTYLQYILGCSRDTVYRKGYTILENKMGFSRNSSSLKKVLKSFMKKDVE